MAPESGIAHGSGIGDCNFWTFIVFVTNGVAMRDLDMMLPENFISSMRAFLEGSNKCDFKRHGQNYKF